ncbi:hypothetical protein [Methylobacterium sp. J-070]|uniref:hypothetical protein n=1 Tax=Methylobacterium sp. J-070 TaxID=2836650 RepID=UPI001FBB966C|nr:hypothetical protein [Methylobacterium sp. J-070]MCJ2051662.1 hypothetical protein [Methylobacterium sp. J-070]
MSLTPNRDAVRAAAIEARERHAPDIARDDAAGIGLRMAIEAAEAIVGGTADMTDREIPVEVIWPQVSMAAAHALTAFLMSIARGDTGLATSFLPGLLASIHECALVRLQRGPDAFAQSIAEIQHPVGRA